MKRKRAGRKVGRIEKNKNKSNRKGEEIVKLTWGKKAWKCEDRWSSQIGNEKKKKQ